MAKVMTKVCLGDSCLSSFPIDVPSSVPEREGIEDHTETNLVNLRRVIYLTINGLTGIEARALVAQTKGEQCWQEVLRGSERGRW